MPNSPRTNKKEPSTSTTASGIQRHNSDQMLKTDVGTAADPREKFQSRKTVSTPSLNFEESTSVDDHSSSATDCTSSTSALLDSSRSQQRSSSLADSDSLVIRQKKRFLNYFNYLMFTERVHF